MRVKTRTIDQILQAFKKPKRDRASNILAAYLKPNKGATRMEIGSIIYCAGTPYQVLEIEGSVQFAGRWEVVREYRLTVINLLTGVISVDAPACLFTPSKESRNASDTPPDMGTAE